jgi:hypothetical protein
MEVNGQLSALPLYAREIGPNIRCIGGKGRFEPESLKFLTFCTALTGCYEFENEPLGSIKDWEFLD